MTEVKNIDCAGDALYDLRSADSQASRFTGSGSRMEASLLSRYTSVPLGMPKLHLNQRPSLRKIDITQNRLYS